MNRPMHSFLFPQRTTAMMLVIVLFATIAEANPVFPLSLSPTKKYLVDQNKVPFLIKEISAWGLIQALSETDELAFIDSVKNKGFNTLLVSIISFDTRFAGQPPNWQGVPPFTVQWDFSTHNPAYFEHADRFLKMARDHGMLVLLVPCYLGYKGDANQGWWDELMNAKNNPAKSLEYGQFLGKHYKDCSNIIWVAGGDNPGAAPWYNHMKNIIDGIKQSDPLHLWTGHFESAQGTNWPSENSLYASYIDVDGLYDFTESSLGSDAPQYKTELKKYGRGKMIFQLDQSYEHDIPHGSDNEDHQWMRRKNYDGLLSGCAGTSFSPGQTDNQCYTFTRWRALMNTQGMHEARYCFEAFETRAWYDLEPIPGESIITKGRGTFGSIDYVCAAMTRDGSLLMAYLPSARTVTIDMNKISGSKVNAFWYNPRTGESSWIGTVSASGSVDFKPFSSGDWLFVIDNREK
ncbi:MAG TPA: DUF4038 domain-containing protein [Puia sp.]|nr:DUF4038 domain-containing protein [Puia sp.]